MSGDVASPEARVAEVFDESAATYERYWAPALSRHARELFDDIPDLEPGARRAVVDVAVGPGALIPVLRAAAGPGGTVLALDRSIGMLRRASGEVPRIQGDAARLPLAADSADIVVQAFVLFMLPDARVAVAEAARVLRAGGWLLAATWGTQSETGAEGIVREEVEAANAPPFPVLPRSDALTDTPEALAALFGAAGFGGVRTTARALDVQFDAASALDEATGMGKVAWQFARLAPDVRDRVRERAAARIAELPAEALIDRSEVLLTTARKN